MTADTSLSLADCTLIGRPDRVAMNGDAGREMGVPISPPTNAMSMIAIPIVIKKVIPIPMVVATKDFVDVPGKAETDDPAVPEPRKEDRVRIAIIGIGWRPIVGVQVVAWRRGDDRAGIVTRYVDNLRKFRGVVSHSSLALVLVSVAARNRGFLLA